MRLMRRLLLIVLAGAVAASVGGCSDEVVCPGVGDARDPFIAGSVVARSGARGDSTSVSVFCSADPLPGLFVVSVNGAAIEDISVAEPPGLLARLEADEVVWAPGTSCTLRVTTEYGFASATATVPGDVSVSADQEVTLGDTLTINWTAADGADYYRVETALTDGDGTTADWSMLTADTTTAVPPDELPFAGTLSGRVSAISGPFPDDGSDGNVTGAGWGFFTIEYGTAGTDFEASVVDSAR